MSRRLASVQTSAPAPLRARSIGLPSPAALESLAAYLLSRILERHRPNLTLVPSHAKAQSTDSSVCRPD